MTVPPAKDLGRNPRTMEEARTLVKYVESLFNPWNVDALVDGFTPDCVVRFADIPPFTGQEKLRELFTSRSLRQKDYKLVKHLRSLMNDTLAIMGEGTWLDLSTGEQMSGWGCEIWQMRDGKIAVWEGAFNAGPAGADVASPFVK
jgi:nuclear transport factor 2 (NTF2) superfamily protein